MRKKRLFEYLPNPRIRETQTLEHLDPPPPLPHPWPSVFWRSRLRNQASTVAILAQGTSWAVAATQAFSLVWNNILSRMTLISYLLLKSNSTGPLNAFRIMLDTFRGMINTFRSIMNTFRNRLKHTPP